MAVYNLTTGDDTLKGRAADDIFRAYVDRSGQLKSTLNDGDTVNGGGGFNTLVLESDTIHDTANGPFNAFLSGNITHIQKLVLTGTYFSGKAASEPALDVRHVSGLQEIWLQDASRFGLTAPAGDYLAKITHLSGAESITVDSLASAGATLVYQSGVTDATVNFTDRSIGAVEVGGDDVDTLTLNGAGSAGHTDLVLLFANYQTHSANLTTLNINSSGARTVVFNGDEIPLLNAIAKAEDRHASVSGPGGYANLTNVTVTGNGGGWVDLANNTQNVTFTGSGGDDAVIVNAANTNGSDHFDGGGGSDIFALSLLHIDKSVPTLAPGAAGYAAINAAQRFEQVGFIGDFKRSIVVDVSQIQHQHTFIIGQSSEFSNLTDADAIKFQLLNSDAIATAHLTLQHAVDAQGHMSGTGLVSVNGADFLGIGPVIKQWLPGSYIPSEGLAVFDAGSVYATLHLSGTFDAEIDGASAWTDASAVSHGVTIDGSLLDGTVTVRTATALSDTLIGGASDDVLGGGQGGDTVTGGHGHDTFVYAHASDSTSTDYDTVTDANFGQDVFDVKGDPGTITGIDAAVSDRLTSGNFDHGLRNALDGHLGAHHAILFTANAGDLRHHAFLVVDENGVAGYQAGKDLVIDVTGHHGTLDPGDFI